MAKKQRRSLKEEERLGPDMKAKWFAQLNGLLQQPPEGMTPDEAKDVGIEVSKRLVGSLDQVNKQLSQFRSLGVPTHRSFTPDSSPSPAPQDDASRVADEQMKRFKSLRKKEGKVITTKKAIREAIHEGIVMHESRKFAKVLIKETVVEQFRSSRLVESLLLEGPLSNIWGGIKQAGKEIGATTAGAARQAASSVGKSFASGQARAQQKTMLDTISKSLKAVSQERQKFSQQTFKTSEIINAYHDSVLGLAQGYRQAAELIPQDSPDLLKMADEVNQAVAQLQKDLQSEKSGIDVFLKNIVSKTRGKNGLSSDQFGGDAMKGADQIPDAPPAQGPSIKSQPAGRKMPRRTTGVR
jgi:hypothetical protein